MNSCKYFVKPRWTNYLFTKKLYNHLKWENRLKFFTGIKKIKFQIKNKLWWNNYWKQMQILKVSKN